MYHRYLLVALAIPSVGSAQLLAQDPGVDRQEIRSAITRAIPLLDKGSAGSAEHRTCFTCHNQALPVMALSEAKKRGFPVDEKNLVRQLKHTFDHLERGRKNYLEGKGQGGRVITAGYALWALEAGDHKPDETTAAVTSFLLQYQNNSDHWRHPGSRPPSSGSDFATTYVALRGLAAFGTLDQQAKIETRIDTVREWLLKSEPKDTEDLVFRLRSLKYAESEGETIERTVAAVIEQQREDGGWAQTSEMKSDAYATATAIVALMEAGDVAADDPAVERGLRFLIDSQLDDGSWHVVTRAKPFQTYYETGFPHAKDQFISIAASSWATLALTRSLPE